MAVALVQEFEIVGDDRSTTNYDHIARRLDFDAHLPEGLIAHTAGWDERGGVFRIVAIWNSPDEAESFMRDRLRPILDEGPADPELGQQPDLESMYELHHCVRGH
jgi:hypothetical protein